MEKFRPGTVEYPCVAVTFFPVHQKEHWSSQRVQFHNLILAWTTDSVNSPYLGGQDSEINVIDTKLVMSHLRSVAVRVRCTSNPLS